MTRINGRFFGSLTFGRAGDPDITADGVREAPSFDDPTATKLRVVPQRAGAKDYGDVAA